MRGGGRGEREGGVTSYPFNLDSSSSPSITQGHTGGVYSIAFSPDGATIASGSDDKTIKLWSVTDGTLQSTLEVSDL